MKTKNSIDNCQNKLSADQYQVTISRAQVKAHSSSLSPGSKAFTGENNVLLIFVKL